MERSTWNQDKAEHIIQKLMLSNDAFSQWMGIEVVEISPISVILSMVITEEMTNGFGILRCLLMIKLMRLLGFLKELYFTMEKNGILT